MDDKKKRLQFKGLPIRIDYNVGDTKKGTNPSTGEPFEVVYKYPYGEIEFTEGRDKDPVDVYLGPNEDSDNVFVVHQLKDNGDYDEDKCFIGFDSKEEAEKAYKDHGPEFGFGSIEELTLDQFENGYLVATRDGDEKSMDKKASYSSTIGFVTSNEFYAQVLITASEFIGRPDVEAIVYSDISYDEKIEKLKEIGYTIASDLLSEACQDKDGVAFWYKDLQEGNFSRFNFDEIFDAYRDEDGNFSKESVHMNKSADVNVLKNDILFVLDDYETLEKNELMSIVQNMYKDKDPIRRDELVKALQTLQESNTISIQDDPVTKREMVMKIASLNKKAGTELWQTPAGKWWLLSTVTMSSVSPLFETADEAIDYAVKQNMWNEIGAANARKHLERGPDGVGDPMDTVASREEIEPWQNDIMDLFGKAEHHFESTGVPPSRDNIINFIRKEIEGIYGQIPSWEELEKMLFGDTKFIDASVTVKDVFNKLSEIKEKSDLRTTIFAVNKAIEDLGSNNFIHIEDSFTQDEIKATASIVDELLGYCNDAVKLSEAAVMFQYDWDRGSAWEVTSSSDGKKVLRRKKDFKKEASIITSKYKEGSLVTCTASLIPFKAVVRAVLNDGSYKIQSKVDSSVYIVTDSDIVSDKESGVF